MPTEHPFLYSVAVTAAEGVPLEAVEEAAVHVLDAVRADGITAGELQRAKHQLRARLVFESDSGTNIAHQLGYFQTIADVDLYHRSSDAIAAVTLDAVARAAASCLRASNRTVGWFKPTAGSAEAQ
jgi:zinc protease